MSYCRKEGKDIIVFATEEDLSGPSSITLLPDDPTEQDSSHQGAILPNGDINWDCPCLGNLPNGPCGSSFRDAFSCWVENKDDQDAFASKCFDNFTAWEECLSENRAIYKSENTDKTDHEVSETQEYADSKVPSETEGAEYSKITDSGGDVSPVKTSKPAIAAAYAEKSRT